ncbi:hypothetical protein GGX14DRAFT_363843, partial [Mycena pura]
MKEVLDGDEEWEDVDALSSRASGLQTWNPWTDGMWERTYPREYFEQCQFAVHWACEVRGGKRNTVGSSRAKERLDGVHTLRLCLGVMKCANRHCDIITRPQTKNSGRLAQIQAGCSCGSQLVHHKCSIRMEYWVYRDGAHFRHSGYHHHERVPARHLTPRERAQFETVIHEHPRMGPAQLLTGRPAVNGPGPSVANISPVLLNQHRIQYERRKILNPENKVRLATDRRFLPKLERFKAKHPEWTIGLHCEGKINVIVLQSPWQRRMGLKDKIRSEAVNGIVSDACHDYFAGHNQLLFLSSTFEPTHLKCWVPIVMTYSNGATAVHYRIHFLYLFRGLAQRCEEIDHDVTDELFANVVDFSDAQRNGFIEAFTDFWREFAPHGRSERDLKKAASELLKGCRQHFDNQITRIAKISRIVGPERHSRFRKLAKELLIQRTMKDLSACANALILEFPAAKPWVEWWMRPSHASMLFSVASGMARSLWESLPATTNGAESMHHKTYRMIGRRNALFYGMEGLVRIAETFERKYRAARTGHKIFYGRDPQYWKTTRFRYSWTKHSRHEPRRKLSMDGRAPDTIARLKGKASKSKRTATVSKAITTPKPPKHLLRQLLEILETQTEQAAFSDFEDSGCNVLTKMRDNFRKKLMEEDCVRGAGSADAIFGWLGIILARLIALKPAPDEANKRCISFFRAYVLAVKKCPGCEAAPLEHWEVSHPSWRLPFQLSEDMHRLFKGDLAKWFRWVLDPAEWDSDAASCWRQWNSNPFCNGAALGKLYILSIPTILVIETGDSLGHSWKIPSSLLPLGKKFAGAGVKYNIVAHIYTDYPVGPGEVAHFIARYVTMDGKIFDYDGTAHRGHATCAPGAKCSGWLSGQSAKLKNLRARYKLIAVIYHLEGGENAQNIFRQER